MAARLWNARFHSPPLSRLAELSLQLAPPGVLPATAGGEQVRFQLPLRDPDRDTRAATAGQPARPGLCPRRWLERNTLAVRLVGGVRPAGHCDRVARSAASGSCTPLAQITESLATERTHRPPPAPAGAKKRNWAASPGWSCPSFAQQQALRLENEERLRTEQALRQSEELVRRSLELRAPFGPRSPRRRHPVHLRRRARAGERDVRPWSTTCPARAPRLQHCRQSLRNERHPGSARFYQRP